MASISDLLTQATTSSRPSPTTATVLRVGGGTTLTVNALTGWPTATAVHFCTYKIDTSGNKIAGSQIDMKGVVSGTTITNIVIKAGTDVGNAVGDIVEAAPTAAWANDVVTWGTAHANQDGSLIQAPVLTAIGTNGISAANLATNAITLGYAQITTSTGAIANNITTGLTATVTIPAGTRRIRITAKGLYIVGSTVNVEYGLAIWDGVVGSGTQLAAGSSTAHANNAFVTAHAVAIVSPAAGSKTYNIGMLAGGGTGNLTASATAPAFIHVEAI